MFHDDDRIGVAVRAAGRALPDDARERLRHGLGGRNVGAPQALVVGPRPARGGWRGRSALVGTVAAAVLAVIAAVVVGARDDGPVGPKPTDAPVSTEPVPASPTSAAAPISVAAAPDSSAPSTTTTAPVPTTASAGPVGPPSWPAPLDPNEHVGRSGSGRRAPEQAVDLSDAAPAVSGVPLVLPADVRRAPFVVADPVVGGFVVVGFGADTDEVAVWRLTPDGAASARAALSDSRPVDAVEGAVVGADGLLYLWLDTSDGEIEWLTAEEGAVGWSVLRSGGTSEAGGGPRSAGTPVADDFGVHWGGDSFAYDLRPRRIDLGTRDMWTDASRWNIRPELEGTIVADASLGASYSKGPGRDRVWAPAIDRSSGTPGGAAVLLHPDGSVDGYRLEPDAVPVGSDGGTLLAVRRTESGDEYLTYDLTGLPDTDAVDAVIGQAAESWSVVAPLTVVPGAVNDGDVGNFAAPIALAGDELWVVGFGVHGAPDSRVLVLDAAGGALLREDRIELALGTVVVHWAHARDGVLYLASYRADTSNPATGRSEIGAYVRSSNTFRLSGAAVPFDGSRCVTPGAGGVECNGEVVLPWVDDSGAPAAADPWSARVVEQQPIDGQPHQQRFRIASAAGQEWDVLVERDSTFPTDYPWTAPDVEALASGGAVVRFGTHPEGGDATVFLRPDGTATWYGHCTGDTGYTCDDTVYAVADDRFLVGWVVGHDLHLGWSPA